MSGATGPAISDWLGGGARVWPAVASLGDGDPLTACFYLTRLDVAQTKQEKPYLRLQLADCHGPVEARVWEDAEAVAARVRTGSFVGVRGRVQVFRGQRQVRIDEIAPITVQPDELGLFMPRSARDPLIMDHELTELVASVRDAPLRLLLDRLLGAGSETGRLFRQVPAAKRNHHAYVGGLLEHTLSLARICDFLASHYGDAVDRDLLLAGALLHDIGKIREIAVEAGFPYTDDGKLLGHIVLGIQIVSEAAGQVAGLSPDRTRLLLHLIAAHQGRYEWQSPREPLTLEALLLHHADDMDAKMTQASAIIDHVHAGWTPFDRGFGRDFLRHRGREPDDTEAAGPIGGQGSARANGPERGGAAVDGAAPELDNAPRGGSGTGRGREAGPGDGETTLGLFDDRDD